MRWLPATAPWGSLGRPAGRKDDHHEPWAGPGYSISATASKKLRPDPYRRRDHQKVVSAAPPAVVKWRPGPFLTLRAVPWSRGGGGLLHRTLMWRPKASPRRSAAREPHWSGGRWVPVERWVARQPPPAMRPSRSCPTAVSNVMTASILPCRGSRTVPLPQAVRRAAAQSPEGAPTGRNPCPGRPSQV